MKNNLLKTAIFLILFTTNFFVNAQNWWFEVNNFSSCNDYVVTAYDALNNPLDQITATNSPSYTGSNVCPITTAIDHITITQGFCTTITFYAVAGLFPFNSVSKTCCGGNNVTISESYQSTCGLNTHHITININ
ncbi:MAG: hypothetical protein H6605_00065 [Flavobacteriales bacterium]|nr:hypothetical protein [Flavobacteriales bacterium]